LDLKLEFDLNEFIPSPNNWFNANIEYDGHGRAEFSDPKGTLEGHVKIKFDEFRKQEITMDVESEESTVGSIIKLLHQNTCSFIEVKTENGGFYSISKIYYDEHFSFHANKDSEIRLRFHILRSIFQPNRANSAMYWVLPLLNFV
jgi:hypothetical protein